jgi:general secretion pathway protein D
MERDKERLGAKLVRSRLLWVCGAALLPMAATAQFDFGGGATGKPWEEFKLNPKTRMKLDFRNASVDMILSLFQKTTGITIVKDPALTGPLTITSAKPVPLNDAFQILQTTLSLKGFDMAKEGKLLVLRKRGDRPAGGGIQFPMPPDMGAPQSELKVYQIQYASASQVARVVNEVFAPQGGGGGNPFAGGFPGGGGGQFRIGGGGQGGGNRFGGPGGFQFGGNRNTPSVRASADDFSNSVVVNAPGNLHDQISTLVRQLDKQTEQPQRTAVYKLTFASAPDIVQTVQSVLTANAPRGRGNTGNQQQGGGGFFNLFRPQSTPGQAQVSAETRSNSLIVTATEDVQSIVSKIVKELDTELPLESSTVVIPLANAKADDVAGLLNQAFGQRQGAGGNFGGNRGIGNQNRNNQNRNNNRNNLGGGGGGGGGGLGGNRAPQATVTASEIALDLQDPNSDAGELQTNVAVAAQFPFFGGGGFGNQNRNNQQQQPARDAQGRIVNVRDLTGQVTTIADPNTNSIIVVTTPENAQLIRNIVEQLDRIPVQVMIETIIVEATLDSSSQFGVEWKFAQTKNGVTNNAETSFGLRNANPPLQGFRYSLTGGNLEAFVNLMKTDTRFNVLSTPRIFTSNNVEAQINISQSVPYVLSSREDANGNLSYNYAFQDVGVVLTVTPRITSNGYVSMEVTQTANDLQGYTSFNAPIVNQRQADTTVSVKDGETIILGGIIRNTVTSSVRKIPLLGDLPILGNLFRSTTKGNQKTELLVFLRPRVVRDEDDARLMRESGTKELSPSTQKALEKSIPPPNNGGGNGNGGG